MTRTPALPLVVAASLAGMRDPIYSLPLHDIDQMRAVAGLLRAFIDEQAPCDNEGEEWEPDPSYQGIVAAWCHLDAAIKASEKPAVCGGALGYLAMVGVPRVRINGLYQARCSKCGAETANDGTPKTCKRPA